MTGGRRRPPETVLRASRRLGRVLGRLVGAGRRQGPAGDDRYRQAWNAAARNDLLGAILTPAVPGTGDSEESFDRKGREDAAWLRRFVTADAVALGVGCGIGRIERHLAPHVARLHAVDVSDDMIAAARRWTAGQRNIAFHRTSATDLSALPAASVDIAYSFFVLQHLEHEDAFRALREIARVLRADGRAVLQFPNLASPVYGQEFVTRADQPTQGPARVRPYTPELVARLLDLATLAVDRFERPRTGTLTEHELVVVARRRADPPIVRDFAVRPLGPEVAGGRAEWAIGATVTDGNADLAGGRVTLDFGPRGVVTAALAGAALVGATLRLRLTIDDAPPGRLDVTLTVHDVVGVPSAPLPFYLTLAGPERAAPAPPLVVRLAPLDEPAGRRP